VITSCAFASAASNPTRASTHSAPPVSWALASTRDPRPSRPQRPPGQCRKVATAVPGHHLGQPLQPPGEQLHSFGPRPFLRPEHGAAPREPTSGVVTSASAMTGRPVPPPVELRQLRQRAAPFGERRSRGIQERPAEAARRARAPVHRGGAPRPTTTVLAPRSTASHTSSPTPRVVARSGSSCSGLRSAMPHAVALSKIAVRDPPIRAHLRPARPGDR